MSALSPSEPRPTPPQPRPRSRPGTDAASDQPVSRWGLRAIDASLVGLFLALTFLLGIFPLKDADFHWHLRTGDLIRKTGQVPRVDFYTFTCQGKPWIDLHWIFQVGISWINQHAGVPGLVLAKAVITCAAVFLLITARRRSWPIWAILLAWLPALLVLSGRMYVRPETLSLLYLAMTLAVISRWDRFPRLAWVLPLVQAAWVNSHGLFLIGLIVQAFALVDAALRRGAFAPERRRWWQIVIPACAASGAACLLNPFGVHGAIFPLELAGTMSNPIFSNNIAELMPIPRFIQKAGFGNLPLQLHLITMALGALSFLIPMFWQAWVRLRPPAGRAAAEPGTALQLPDARKRKEPARPKRSKQKLKRAQDSAAETDDGWRLSPLRLLLFAAFSALSFQATRNSHQFAAVLGTITAWNFGEWAAAVRRLGSTAEQPEGGTGGLRPRLVTLVALAGVLAWVASGHFYRIAGEGRTIGWGEEPLWFPHRAAKFAGTEGMPEHFLSYHNGHASVFIYYNSPERPGGPGRTVYTDPRLEVAGAELFERYQMLGKRIGNNEPGWEAELDQNGRPSILVDHQENAQIGSSLLASPRWRCVWFDPAVAVFVHESYDQVIRNHTVDFAARHFRPDPAAEPHGTAELLSAAKGVRNYLNFAISRGELPRPLVWLGLDYARRLAEADPDSPEGWKALGQIELLRDPPSRPSPRFRGPFDPALDLAMVRATYAFRRALDLAPGDFMALIGLEQALGARQLDEAMLPVLERLEEVYPINPYQREHQAQARSTREQLARRLSKPVETTWKNSGDLDRIVTEELDLGRAETAAGLLERAYPPENAPWDVVDRAATLRLHLGQPDRALDLWRRASNVPRPAIREARVAASELVLGQFSAARRSYEKALASEPNLFEARYGLAVLEQDDGHAAAAYEHARAAIEAAPTDFARAAARAIASAVSRFAREEAGRSVTGRGDPGTSPEVPTRAVSSRAGGSEGPR
ncbi:MAG: hypothetical protein U0790_05730 [Isosphaeraceae bacterium]